MQLTRPSLFAKVGLICDTIDWDEERDGKQREIVKTNTRRLRGPVYHASYMSFGTWVYCNSCLYIVKSLFFSVHVNDLHQCQINCSIIVVSCKKLPNFSHMPTNFWNYCLERMHWGPNTSVLLWIKLDPRGVQLLQSTTLIIWTGGFKYFEALFQGGPFFSWQYHRPPTGFIAVKTCTTRLIPFNKLC